MIIPNQPINQKIFKYTITFMIVLASVWSAAGLEITMDRILDAPRQIAFLIGAMFPLDTAKKLLNESFLKFLNHYLLLGLELLLVLCLVFLFRF